MEFPSIAARREKRTLLRHQGREPRWPRLCRQCTEGRRRCRGRRERSARSFRRCALLILPDVLEALRDLARAGRARTNARVIAVTGSVGKTGAKEALRLALSTDGETHASIASYNNHWGVPLSLARCPASTKYAIFEIGMNHAGESLLSQSWRVRTWPLLPALSPCTLNTLARSRRSPMPRQNFCRGRARRRRNS